MSKTREEANLNVQAALVPPGSYGAILKQFNMKNKKSSVKENGVRKEPSGKVSTEDLISTVSNENNLPATPSRWRNGNTQGRSKSPCRLLSNCCVSPSIVGSWDSDDGKLSQDVGVRDTSYPIQREPFPSRVDGHRSATHSHRSLNLPGGTEELLLKCEPLDPLSSTPVPVHTCNLYMRGAVTGATS